MPTQTVTAEQWVLLELMRAQYPDDANRLTASPTRPQEMEEAWKHDKLWMLWLEHG